MVPNQLSLDFQYALYIALGLDFDFSEVSLQILAQFFASKKHNCIFDIVLIIFFLNRCLKARGKFEI